MKHRSERTLVIIKPDGVQRSLIGEVIKRYERVGLKLIGIKMVHAPAQMVEQHYTLDPQWRRVAGEKTIKGYRDKGLIPPSEDPFEITGAILKKLGSYMSSGPVVCMIWQGPHAVAVVRKLTGSTEPLASDVGTIRGDYMIDSYEVSDKEQRSIRNIVHASGSVAEAEQEITHWFDASEIVEYPLVQEQLLRD